MGVDVQTEIEIDRPRAEVAAFAADPDKATRWYENIKTVETFAMRRANRKDLAKLKAILEEAAGAR